jgi:hypothetical protein
MEGRGFIKPRCIAQAGLGALAPKVTWLQGLKAHSRRRPRRGSFPYELPEAWGNLSFR